MEVKKVGFQEFRLNECPLGLHEDNTDNANLNPEGRGNHKIFDTGELSYANLAVDNIAFQVNADPKEERD